MQEDCTSLLIEPLKCVSVSGRDDASLAFNLADLCLPPLIICLCDLSMVLPFIICFILHRQN